MYIRWQVKWMSDQLRIPPTSDNSPRECPLRCLLSHPPRIHITSIIHSRYHHVSPTPSPRRPAEPIQGLWLLAHVSTRSTPHYTHPLTPPALQTPQRPSCSCDSARCSHLLRWRLQLGSRGRRARSDHGPRILRRRLLQTPSHEQLTDKVQLATAIGSEGASPIIRVPWPEEWMIKRALDSGAHGILTPMCHSAVGFHRGTTLNPHRD